METTANPRIRIAHGTFNTYKRHGCRCDPCREVAAELQRKRLRANPEKVREFKRAASKRWYYKNRDAILERKRLAHKDAETAKKHNARSRVRLAIAAGNLVPQACEIGADCHGNIEAHHDDYSKPLAVRWLCKIHHVAHHMARGEESS